MAYETLQIGSKNTEEIKKLQTTLQEKGYYKNGQVDGAYGNLTAAAVKQYQKDNALSVDGIAGNETLGHLYKKAAPEPGSSIPDADTPVGTVATPLQQAQDILNQQLQNKPSYGDIWSEEMQKLMKGYLDREDFSYDVNNDPLYRQLQDQYVAQGQLAMQDAMGQAAAYTGGYGSSYGQAVGQQTYQSYLQQLTDKIPELYQLARQNYDAEGQELLNRFSLISTMDDREYSRYIDDLNTWISERDYLQGVVETERSWQYQQETDAYNKLNTLLSTGYDPTDEELSAAGMTREQADSIRKAHTSTYSGAGNRNRDSGDKIEIPPYEKWGYDTLEEMEAGFLSMAEEFGLQAVEQYLDRETRYGVINVTTRNQILLDISDLYYEKHPKELPQDFGFNEYAYNRLEEGYSGRIYS